MNEKASFGLVPTNAAYEAAYDPVEENWGEGRWLDPAQNIEVPMQSLVFSYAYSVFEGMKAYRLADRNSAMIFRAADHAKRMARSAGAVYLQPFPEDHFIKAIIELVQRNAEHIPLAGEGALYLRPVLFADEAKLGLNPSESARFTVYASPVKPYFSGQSGGLRLKILPRSRVAKEGIGWAKCSANYAGSLRGMLEARSEGFNDAVYTEDDGRTMTEATGANLFFLLRNGTVVTPAANDQILPGITRDSVLTLLRQEDIRVEERPMSVNEAFSATEMFCTGTAWGVVGVEDLVSESDGSKHYDSNELSSSLAKKMRQIQSGSVSDPFNSPTIELQ